MFVFQKLAQDYCCIPHNTAYITNVQLLDFNNVIPNLQLPDEGSVAVTSRLHTDDENMYMESDRHTSLKQNGKGRQSQLTLYLTGQANQSHACMHIHNLTQIAFHVVVNMTTWNEVYFHPSGLF